MKTLESDFLKKSSLHKLKQSGAYESEIETHFVRYAKSKFCITYKLCFYNRRGFPDITVICPNGFIFFIEFKRKTGKLSHAQEIVKSELVANQVTYFICYEIGQAEKILDDILNEMEPA